MKHLNIRWLIRRDMPRVLEIERQSFEHVWTEEDFMCCLRQRNCIGMVASNYSNTEVFGWMIYELHKSNLHILNFAVAPEFRREGVGCQMIDRLKDKLPQQRRHRILADVRESNLTAQFFWRSMGFRAVQVLRDYYEQDDEDAYRFVYDLRADDSVGPIGTGEEFENAEHV